MITSDLLRFDLHVMFIVCLEYEKERSIKPDKNRTTVTKRTTQTRSSFDMMMNSQPKTKRSPVYKPIVAQTSLDTDDDPDCQLLPECREAVRIEYTRYCLLSTVRWTHRLTSIDFNLEC
jgi:ssDNA-binding Zn-finger/Zn-ribbon topoisomerase 1